MYNSIYPVNIHYRKPQANRNIVKRKEEENSYSSPSSQSNEENKQDEFTSSYSTRPARTTFSNGSVSSIDYNKNVVNISQIVTDFKNTTAAIGTPKDISEEVMTYLKLVETQAVKSAPNKKIIQSNLKNASQILDTFISTSLNKPSKVVEEWVDAIFLQNVEYRANPNAINPDFKVQFPDKTEPHEVIPEPENTQAETKIADIQEETTNNTNLSSENNSPELKESVEQKENKNIYIPQDKELKREFIKGKKYMQLNNKADALSAFKEALKIADSQNDEQALSMIYYEIGQIYDKSDLDKLAIENYQISINKTENNNIKAKAHISMAQIYNKDAKFAPAMTHYHDAMSYAGQTENLNLQTKALSDVAKMFTERYNKNQAFQYFDLAKEIAKETQNDKIVGKIYKNTAKACEILSENQLALDNLRQSTYYYSKANSDDKIAENYTDAADLMIKFGNKSKAQTLLKKAYKKYAQLGSNKEIKSIFMKMQEVKV